MLSGNGYTYEVDIWSAGVVLYVLLCGKTPFDAENESARSMYEKIQNTELDLSSGEWSSISDSAKELVLGMLQKDSTHRLSCYRILSELLFSLDFVDMQTLFVNRNQGLISAV